jgi:AcrR family transcriptional regulator
MPESYLEARTTAIREAAMRVFVRKGITTTTMQDIASEAGMSAGGIYRYFEGKEQLVRAVFEQCREQNRALFDDTRSESDSPLDRFFAVGRSVWDEFKEAGIRDQYAVRLAATLVGSRAGDPLGDEMRAMHREVLERIAMAIREIQGVGEMRQDIDADALALTVLSCVQGLRLLFLEFEQEIDTEGVYEVLSRMLEGFRPVQEEV